jgi:hypothetical protein
MAELPPSEVKGVWFVSALDYARELHGDAQVDEWIQRAHLGYRDIYQSPIPSAWYPEASFQEALSMIYELVAQENAFLFEQIIEGCTEKGVNRLFKMLLRVSSAAFVLRRVPTMWRQIRRGAGHVEVLQQGGHSIVSYTEFPWFKDPLYRMLTTASLRAVVRTCTQRAPRVEVMDFTHDSLSVHIAYRCEPEFSPLHHVSTRPPPRNSLIQARPQASAMSVDMAVDPITQTRLKEVLSESAQRARPAKKVSRP